MENSRQLFVSRTVGTSEKVVLFIKMECFLTEIGIGVRAIFCQGGGAVNYLPKKFLQVAQIFTKQSNRNEGHTMQQHRSY